MTAILTKRQRELNQKVIKRIVELKQEAYRNGYNDKYKEDWMKR